MSDKPHDKAVRSPWTEGAWIMRSEDVPSTWTVRRYIGAVWAYLPAGRYTPDCIVEARPKADQ